jgi:hypothetical protein
MLFTPEAQIKRADSAVDGWFLQRLVLVTMATYCSFST